MDFTQDLADELYSSGEQFPVDLDDAWKWIGYNRKESAVRALSNFKRDSDFRQAASLVDRPQGGTVEIDKYWLTVDCFKMMGMMAKTEQGDLIRRYFLNCEKRMKQLAMQYEAREVEAVPEPIAKLPAPEVQFEQYQSRQLTGVWQVDELDELRLKRAKFAKDYKDNPDVLGKILAALDTRALFLSRSLQEDGFAVPEKIAQLLPIQANQQSIQAKTCPVVQQECNLTPREVYERVQDYTQGRDRVILQEVARAVILEAFPATIERTANQRCVAPLKRLGFVLVDQTTRVNKYGEPKCVSTYDRKSSASN